MDCMKKMACLRKEEETVEIGRSSSKVWMTIQKVLTSLE
jgi:hypothetical protein